MALIPILSACCVALTWGSTAWAQAHEDWAIKLGYNRIFPQVRTSALSAPSLPGSHADVGPGTNLIVTLAYHWHEHWSAELFLGTPSRHELRGAGALNGVGNIGTVVQLPPTVFLQYRGFAPKHLVRPYAGLGLTVAVFRSETGSATLTAITNPGSSQPTSFSVDPAIGLTPQVGLTVDLGEPWFVDLGLARSFIKTQARFSTGQSIKVRLDPWIANLSIGWRFR